MGVARVQIALLEAGLAPGTEPLFDLTTFSPEQGRFVRVPEALAMEILHMARAGGRHDDPPWRALHVARKAARVAALGFEFAPGDRVLALGLTGGNPNQLRRLRELRQTRGVLVCVLFYDAIPLATPEHCDEALSRSFSEHFLGMCLQIDRAVAISAHSAQEFRSWQRRFLPGIDIPVGIMPLNAPFAPLSQTGPEPEPAELPAALGRPFVLCVATIESRKGHLLILNAWLTLLRRHGAAVMPDLVMVGRDGFLAEPVLRLIHAAPELRACVKHFRDIGDGLLALLYQRSLFTIFNSFHEGWGMPVTEALAHGKIPLTPDHTSLREAGGAAAQYFTPQSEPELADLAWRLIRDPEHRRALEARIPERMPLRDWRAVAQGLIATLATDLPSLPDPAERLFFPMGERIGFDAPIIPDLPALMPPASLLHQLLCEGEGWCDQERWGIGATWGSARLRLPLRTPPPGPLVLLLEVAAPADAPAMPRLRVIPPGMAPGPWLTDVLPAGTSRPIRVDIPTCEPGQIIVELDMGEPSAQGGRPVRLFFTGLFLCAEADHAGLLHYLAARAGMTCARPA